MRIKFEDFQFQETGYRLWLVQYMRHRRLGTNRVIERFLKLSDVLRKHYFQAERKPFPVDESKDALIESFL